MSFMVSDRLAVARLVYQMKKFQEGLGDDELQWMLPALDMVRQRMSAHYDEDGENCRGLGLDHRWQTEANMKVFCTKCGVQRK